MSSERNHLTAVVARMCLFVMACGVLQACSAQLGTIRDLSASRDDERVSLVSSESIDPSDCSGSARQLGQAFSKDMMTIWDGTFDRGRVVVQTRRSPHAELRDPTRDHLSKLVLPLSREYVPIEDLSGLYILPAYPTAWIRLSEIHQTSSCDPDSWATKFTESIDEPVLERLAATEPSFGATSASASDLVHRVIHGSLSGYHRWLQGNSPNRVQPVR